MSGLDPLRTFADALMLKWMSKSAALCVLVAFLGSCGDHKVEETDADTTLTRVAPVQLERTYRDAATALHSVLRCEGVLEVQRQQVLSRFHALEDRIQQLFGAQELRLLRLKVADSQHMVMVPSCPGPPGLKAFASAVAALEATIGRTLNRD